MDIIKVVWICGFSNPEIRSLIKKRVNPIESLGYMLVHKKYDPDGDMGIWITNGIREIKKRDDVELHIISLQRDLSSKRQDEKSDGIFYHFFREEDSGIIRKIKRYLFTKNSSMFKQNRKMICKTISTIQPDVVHVIGAENPFYSLALLDISKSIPTILQLQALLVSLSGKVSGEEAKNYAYKGEIEKELIKRADYVGTTADSFVEYIRNHISSDIKLINTSLPMRQTFNHSEVKKEFTFVHYAGELREAKATDIAVKAFIVVHRKYPEITLDLVGSYSNDFRQYLDSLLDEAHVKDAVSFEGRLPTHEDVIHQIRKAKFALLPIKIDIFPNTVHEAMANGLPVVTTITENGTGELNKDRESVLLSPIGDVDQLAINMEILIQDPYKAELLRRNAQITESEYGSNKDVIDRWVDVYKAIMVKSKTGEEIPQEYFWQ